MTATFNANVSRVSKEAHVRLRKITVFQAHARMGLVFQKMIPLNACAIQDITEACVIKQFKTCVNRILVNMVVACIRDLHRSNVHVMQVTLARFVKH